MKQNGRMAKVVVPVLDLATGRAEAYAGWENRSGVYVLPHGDSDPREVAYVNVGRRGAYVFTDQLMLDIGLFAYAQRFGGG